MFHDHYVTSANPFKSSSASRNGNTGGGGGGCGWYITDKVCFIEFTFILAFYPVILTSDIFLVCH